MIQMMRVIEKKFNEKSSSQSPSSCSSMVSLADFSKGSGKWSGQSKIDRKTSFCLVSKDLRRELMPQYLFWARFTNTVVVSPNWSSFSLQSRGSKFKLQSLKFKDSRILWDLSTRFEPIDCLHRQKRSPTEHVLRLTMEAYLFWSRMPLVPEMRPSLGRPFEESQNEFQSFANETTMNLADQLIRLAKPTWLIS